VQAGKSLLKNEYDESVGVDEALKLAVKVLVKTMDATSASADKLEFCVLTREGDKCVQRILPGQEVTQIIDEVNTAAASEGDE